MSKLRGNTGYIVSSESESMQSLGLLYAWKIAFQHALIVVESYIREENIALRWTKRVSVCLGEKEKCLQEMTLNVR